MAAPDVQTRAATIRVPKALIVMLLVLALPAAQLEASPTVRSTRDLQAEFDRGYAEGKRDQKQACRPILSPEKVSYMHGYLDGKAELPRQEPTKIRTFGDC